MTYLETLLEAAAVANGGYRCDEDESALEVGFLYGSVETIIALIGLLPGESYLDKREALAEEIDRRAAIDSYALLKKNGGRN